jgi:hypothetical protein
MTSSKRPPAQHVKTTANPPAAVTVLRTASLAGAVAYTGFAGICVYGAIRGNAPDSAQYLPALTFVFVCLAGMFAQLWRNTRNDENQAQPVTTHTAVWLAYRKGKIQIVGHGDHTADPAQAPRAAGLGFGRSAVIVSVDGHRT